MSSTKGTVTIRIHHDVRSATLLGRAIGVDRLPVAPIRGTDVTEFEAPAGVHILHVRNGVFFSCAVRYAASAGSVLEYEIRLADSGLAGLFFGGAAELRPLPKTVPVTVVREGTIPLSRVIAQSVTVP